jgi:hypothetical protein
VFAGATARQVTTVTVSRLGTSLTPDFCEFLPTGNEGGDWHCRHCDTLYKATSFS